MFRAARNLSFAFLVVFVSLGTARVHADDDTYLQCLTSNGCFEIDCFCGTEEAYMYEWSCDMQASWCPVGVFSECPPPEFADICYYSAGSYWAYNWANCRIRQCM